MFRRMLMISVAAFVMLSLPAMAHHSTAAFVDNEVTQKGTVVEFIWGNPHVEVVWDVKDDSGNVVRWRGELASVQSVMADGLNKDSLKPGDGVLMTVRAAKAGTPHSVINQIRRADGTMVLAWSRQGGGSAADRAARAAAEKADSNK
jgi:hypothetical protein